MNPQAILEQALKLPSNKREKFVEALVSSIKRPSKRHLDALWAHEAESRVDALISGKLKAVPGHKVLAYRKSA